MTIDVGLIYSDKNDIQKYWLKQCLTSLEGADVRLNMLNHAQNGLGVKSNRLLTLEGNSEFMSYVDYDDWVEKEAFYKAIEYLRTHPDIGGIYFQSEWMTPSGSFVRYFHPPDNQYSFERHKKEMNHARQLCVFRRRVYEKVVSRASLVPEPSFDRCLTFAIGLVAGWHYDPTVAYHFRDHPGGVHNSQASNIRTDFNIFVNDVLKHGI